MKQWIYDVLIYKGIDGDSIRTQLDTGFRCRIDLIARLHGVDMPEKRTVAGKLVAEYVVQWLIHQNKKIQVESIADDKYAGRYLAVMFADTVLNERLITLGLGRICLDGKRRRWLKADLKKSEKAAKEALKEFVQQDSRKGRKEIRCSVRIDC